MARLLPAGLRHETAATLARLRGDGEVAAASLLKGKIDYEPYGEIFRSLQLAIRAKKICKVAYKAPRKREPGELLFAPQRLLVYHETIYAEGWLLENGE